MRVGIVGCGNVAENYVHGIRRFGELSLVGCASRSPASAARLAEGTGIRAFPTVEDLLGDPSLDAVVNLTPPRAHLEVSHAALAAGKHVYSEKPLTADWASAEPLLHEASDAGLLIGAAPDTFLGGGAQQARAALDAGVIGVPIACTAFVRSTKAEEWHPDPSFLFQEGGGPDLDLGPYYLTLLVSLLGPVTTVSAMAAIGTPTRRFTAPDRVADAVEVTVPTHLSASLQFGSGVIGTVVASFDVWDTTLPYVEIYGDEGTMALGNPDVYDWPVRIKRRSDADWSDLPPLHSGSLARSEVDYRLRGIGILDLARATDGAPHRASGALGAHVLEGLAAFRTSAAHGRTVQLTSSVERPEPWSDPVGDAQSERTGTLSHSSR
jgi:predicted dehydrogenase